MERTEKLQVTVTQQDIMDGVRNSCSGCPIAVRLRKLGFPFAYVYSNNVRLYGEAVVALPHEAVQFIKAFDTHGHSDAAPFKFVLDVPVDLMMSRIAA